MILKVKIQLGSSDTRLGGRLDVRLVFVSCNGLVRSPCNGVHERLPARHGRERVLSLEIRVRFLVLFLMSRV